MSLFRALFTGHRAFKKHPNPWYSGMQALRQKTEITAIVFLKQN